MMDIRRDWKRSLTILAFSQNIETDYDELEEILRKITTFDPSRNCCAKLPECLMIQLGSVERHPDDPAVRHRI